MGITTLNIIDVTPLIAANVVRNPVKHDPPPVHQSLVSYSPFQGVVRPIIRKQQLLT